MSNRVPVAAMAVLLSACAAGPATSPGESGPASVTPSASAAPSDTPEPTVPASTAPASAEASAPEGSVYPFTLVWPADHVIQDWRYATTAWDGGSRIDSGNRYTDLMSTTEGRLFTFGVPTDDGPEELRDLVAVQAAGWHGCDQEPSVEESVIGGGEDGIYGVYTCSGSTVLRWFGVHEGFGLVVALILASQDELDEAATLFKAQIGELEWSD